MTDRVEQVRVDLTANDQASKPIDHVADEAERLEKLDPTVTVDADVDDAKRGIRTVDDLADKLSREDVELVIRAQIDQLKAQAKEAQAALDGISDKADDTARHIDKIGTSQGPRLAGNQVADLTGPFGDASGAASNFGGVFDGLADISEKVAGKMGLDAAAISSAVSGIGFAVAGVAALWSIYSAKQQQAAQRARELASANEEIAKSIREGNREAATSKIVDQYSELIVKAHAAGVSVRDVVGFITGQGDATRQLAEMESKLNDFTVIGNVRRSETIDLLTQARDSYQKVNGTLDDQASILAAVDSALGGVARKQDDVTAAVDGTRNAFDKLRDKLNVETAIHRFQDQMWGALQKVQEGAQLSVDDIDSIKQSIIDAGEAAGLNPIQVQTEVEKVTAQNVAEVFQETQAMIDRHKALQLQAQIDLSIKAHSGKGNFRLGPDGELIVGTGATAAPSSIVNVNMPRGSTGVDVLRQLSGQARRSGRRYGASVVHYARR